MKQSCRSPFLSMKQIYEQHMKDYYVVEEQLWYLPVFSFLSLAYILRGSTSAFRFLEDYVRLMAALEDEENL